MTTDNIGLGVLMLRIRIDARLKSGLSFEPPGEVVLVHEPELFAYLFHKRFVLEQAGGFPEKEGVPVFAERLSGGLLKNPVQVIGLVSHASGQAGNFR